MFEKSVTNRYSPPKEKHKQLQRGAWNPEILSHRRKMREIMSLDKSPYSILRRTSPEDFDA